MRATCDAAARFIHTPDGFQEWAAHVDACDECKKDLEYFHPTTEEN